MQKLIISLLLSVFFLDYIATDMGLLPRIATWIPELLSGVALLLILGQLAKTRSLVIAPKYVLFGIILIAFLATTVAINAVQAGAIFAGIRTYFRYLPLFLLPSIFPQSEKMLQVQLKLVLVCCFIQLPIAFYQKYFKYASKSALSGDWIVGTLQVSSLLSIVLVSAIAIVFAFTLRGRIKPWQAGLIILWLVIPTTINETKGTLFLLPIALFIPTLITAILKKQLSVLVPVMALSAFLVLGFTFVHQLVWQDRGKGQDDLSTFMLEGRFLDYLYRDVDYNESTGKVDDLHIGKMDSIALAFKVLSKDPMELLIGKGMGNVSKSFNRLLEGEYEKYAGLGTDYTMFGFLLWEIGLVGIAIVVTGCFMVAKDAYSLSRSPDFFGIFASGWVAIVFIYITSLFYKNIIAHNAIGFMFWYFSGVIVYQSFKFRLSQNASPE
ncbi:MAG: hypothetical protein IPM37_03150 [Hahellaceae bacterium]|nr:hypothetical protein [Hahellaceae bacterium]